MQNSFLLFGQYTLTDDFYIVRNKTKPKKQFNTMQYNIYIIILSMNLDVNRSSISMKTIFCLSSVVLKKRF